MSTSNVSFAALPEIAISDAGLQKLTAEMTMVVVPALHGRHQASA